MGIKKEKARQLGMNPSTASNRLVKLILFNLMKKTDQHWCFQCGAEIEGVHDMSVEHKEFWLYSENPIDMYFNMENIAFSHKVCNYKASRPRGKTIRS